MIPETNSDDEGDVNSLSSNSETLPGSYIIGDSIVREAQEVKVMIYIYATRVMLEVTGVTLRHRTHSGTSNSHLLVSLHSMALNGFLLRYRPNFPEHLTTWNEVTPSISDNSPEESDSDSEAPTHPPL
jgi:hypothetical protein